MELLLGAVIENWDFSRGKSLKRAFDHGSAIVDHIFDWPGNRASQHPAAYYDVKRMFQ